MKIRINDKLLFLMFTAFTFSIVVRLIWVYQFSSAENFIFNGQFMINTNDGYFWAEGARDILSGVSQENDLSPVSAAPAYLTAFLAKILPVSFETIIFYMSAFFSSLVVIPLILLGQHIKKVEVGFIAALLASIAWSYYNRTMAGYYDTDMLNILFPVLLLWSLILAIETKMDKYILLVGLEIIAYRWWYPQSYSLEFAFFGLILVYTIFFDKKSIYNYKLLSIMLFAMMGLPILTRFIIVLGLYGYMKTVHTLRVIYIVLGIVLLAFLMTGGLDPIWDKLKSYVFKDPMLITDDSISLHFYSVMQTIREAGKIPFETFANRISGHTLIFILSIVGYLLLVIKHRAFLLALPMLGLGFLAYSSGLRFTIYAVPVMALGMAYLIVFLTSFIKEKTPRYAARGIFTIIVLIPNIIHVIHYKVPTVFTKEEVVALDKLRDVVTREDYVLSWWDYGYPIRYYSDVKTLGDGSKHGGAANFPLSFTLINEQNMAAKMARLEVEYTENTFKIAKENEKLEEDQKIKRLQNTAQMIIDYGHDNSNDFLLALSTDIKLPKKSRDIYLYLPNRLLNILPTVTLFSNLDLMSGKRYSQPFFYQTTQFKENSQTIDLGRGIKLLKKQGVIEIGNNKVPIKNFVVTSYSKNKLKKTITTVNTTAQISVIYMKNYHKFLILDEKMYNSTFIQLFVLENYDSSLFEPTIITPLVKIYKLRI